MKPNEHPDPTSDARESAEKAVAFLQDELAEQREILGKLPQCWQLVDVFLTQDCPVVPGMKLIVVEGQDDREILVDEVGSSHLTVADKVEEDGGFWENIQPEDCADSPQAAIALRKRKAKDAEWETTDKNDDGSCVSG